MYVRPSPGGVVVAQRVEETARRLFVVTRWPVGV